LICWGMQGKSVPRQERNGSERTKVASVAERKPPREPLRPHGHRLSPGRNSGK
jgi:hypothetical protein